MVFTLWRKKVLRFSEFICLGTFIPIEVPWNLRHTRIVRQLVTGSKGYENTL